MRAFNRFPMRHDALSTRALRGNRGRLRRRLSKTSVWWIVATAVLLSVTLPSSALARPVRPGVPNPIAPSGTIYTEAPKFSWDPATDAASYEVRVYERHHVVGSATGITGNSWVSGPLPTNVALTWKVRGISSGGHAGSYSTSLSFTVTPLSVGQPFQGGRIAYILQSGDTGFVAGETHGLIVAAAYQYMPWWNLGTSGTACDGSGSGVVLGTTAALGDGPDNTAVIVATYGSSGNAYAAGWVDGLVSGGQSDWYLPSVAEFDKLKQSYAAGLLLGNTWPTDQSYWSSTDSNESGAIAGCRARAAGILDGQDWFDGFKYATATAIPFRSFGVQ